MKHALLITLISFYYQNAHFYIERYIISYYPSLPQQMKTYGLESLAIYFMTTEVLFDKYHLFITDLINATFSLNP